MPTAAKGSEHIDAHDKSATFITKVMAHVRARTSFLFFSLQDFISSGWRSAKSSWVPKPTQKDKKGWYCCQTIASETNYFRLQLSQIPEVPHDIIEEYEFQMKSLSWSTRYVMEQESPCIYGESLSLLHTTSHLFILRWEIVSAVLCTVCTIFWDGSWEIPYRQCHKPFRFNVSELDTKVFAQHTFQRSLLEFI